MRATAAGEECRGGERGDGYRGGSASSLTAGALARLIRTAGFYAPVIPEPMWTASRSRFLDSGGDGPSPSPPGRRSLQDRGETALILLRAT
jgi:hypothetical protein